MEEKNLIEELRSENLASAGNCTRLLNWNGGRCSDFAACAECRLAALNALADRIEEEFAPKNLASHTVNGFEWPCFEDGTPIQKDDPFIANGGKPVKLTSIRIACDGEAVLNPCAWDEDYSLRIELRNDEHVRRQPADSLEKVYEDAKLSPFEYCEDILNWSTSRIYNANHSDRLSAMTTDLLERQRKLLENK